MKDQQTALALAEPPAAITPMGLLQIAIEREGSIDVIERLAKLQSDERDYRARVAFDDALNQCQRKIGRVAPNQKRNDTSSWWADYAQLDRTVRAVYTDAGFSIGFSQVESMAPGKVRIKGMLSRSGVSRDYFSEITPSTTGPKGNAMATATDADAIALARAKRYILLDIFNISIGIDTEEKKGIPTNALSDEEFAPYQEAIQYASDGATLKAAFEKAYKVADDRNDTSAVKDFVKFRDLRKLELQREGRQ